MKNETCEPATLPTHNSVIVGCKMYMAEVLGAKSISWNKLDMKNENKFHFYYHKQNQNSEILSLHLKTLKIILNKI